MFMFMFYLCYRFESGVPGGVSMLREELALLQSELSSVGSPIVFCHNDLLLANVIHRPTSVTFIDYEYASYNYQAFDIGNHFDEFAGNYRFFLFLYILIIIFNYFFFFS